MLFLLAQFNKASCKVWPMQGKFRRHSPLMALTMHIPSIACNSCHNDIFANIPLIEDFLNHFTNVVCGMSYWKLLYTQTVAEQLPITINLMTGKGKVALLL